MTRLWKFFMGPLVALGLLAALAAGVLAQDLPPAELMAEANRRYQRGEYAEAAQQYEALIGRGYWDAAVHYNLGNAYLESGGLGRAVLNYLRAEELSPRDPDILANLAIARSRTVDQLEAEGDSLVASVADLGAALGYHQRVRSGGVPALDGRRPCRGIPHPLAGLPPESHPAQRGGCRLCRHAGSAGAAAEYVVLQPLRQHRRRNRRHRGGPERAGAAVRRGVRPA